MEIKGLETSPLSTDIPNIPLRDALQLTAKLVMRFASRTAPGFYKSHYKLKMRDEKSAIVVNENGSAYLTHPSLFATDIGFGFDHITHLPTFALAPYGYESWESQGLIEPVTEFLLEELPDWLYHLEKELGSEVHTATAYDPKTKTITKIYSSPSGHTAMRYDPTTKDVWL